MTFSAVIGSYSMPSAVEMNVHLIRKVMGDIPILISDDPSNLSDRIQILANKLGVDYISASGTRGHFAGDCNAFLNGLVHGKVNSADVVIKISQRFMLLDPALRQVFEASFKNPSVWVALPGKPNPNLMKAEGVSFSAFDFLTDIVLMRTAEVDPEYLRAEYVRLVQTVSHPTATYIEHYWKSLLQGAYNGHWVVVPQITDHRMFHACQYLRRYQNTQADYRKVAQELGMNYSTPLSNWKALQPGYDPRPKVV